MNEQPDFDAEGMKPERVETLSPAAEFPWPPAEDASVIDAFIRTWTEASFHPKRFYAAMPTEAPLGPSMLYYLVVGVVIAAIGMFWALVLPQAEIDPATMPNALAMARSSSPLVGFLLSPVIQIMGLFIGAAITHVMLLILTTERGSYSRTVRVYCFAHSPSMVLSILPYVGWMIGAIWSLVIAIIGLREAHRTTTGRAAMAVLLPSILIFILGMVIVMVVLASGLLLLQ